MLLYVDIRKGARAWHEYRKGDLGTGRAVQQPPHGSSSCRVPGATSRLESRNVGRGQPGLSAGGMKPKCRCAADGRKQQYHTWTATTVTLGIGAATRACSISQQAHTPPNSLDGGRCVRGRGKSLA